MGVGGEGAGEGGLMFLNPETQGWGSSVSRQSESQH